MLRLPCSYLFALIVSVCSFRLSQVMTVPVTLNFNQIKRKEKSKFGVELRSNWNNDFHQTILSASKLCFDSFFQPVK